MDVFFSEFFDRDVTSKVPLRICPSTPSSQTVGADPLIPSILFHVSCKVPKASGGNNAGDYSLAEKQRVNPLNRTWTALVAVRLIPQRCQRRRMRATRGLKILKLRPRPAAQRAQKVELRERLRVLGVYCGLCSKFKTYCLSSWRARLMRITWSSSKEPPLLQRIRCTHITQMHTIPPPDPMRLL